MSDHNQLSITPVKLLNRVYHLKVFFCDLYLLKGVISFLMVDVGGMYVGGRDTCRVDGSGVDRRPVHRLIDDRLQRLLHGNGYLPVMSEQPGIADRLRTGRIRRRKVRRLEVGVGRLERVIAGVQSVRPGGY